MLFSVFSSLTCRLSDHAKKLINDLGSGLIQNLKYRDNWLFVGQKGIHGFVDLEQVIVSGSMCMLDQYPCMKLWSSVVEIVSVKLG